MVQDRVEMSTVYGPVPSWRFGRSLGIDAIVGTKICTFNCIYCQLGKTAIHVASPEGLRNPVTAEKVRDDLKSYLAKIDLDSIDVITFSGSGEPTLNLQLGKMVEHARELSRKKLPIVLHTNASLLHRNDVKKNVSRFDVVCAKLDAGDEQSFKIINRPVKEAASFGRVVRSIKELKANLTGKLMTQTMFLRTTSGFSNCEGPPLESVVDTISKIDPDVVQIDTPYRPSAEKFVRHADIDELSNIADKFQKNFSKTRLWIFGIHDMRGKRVTWRERESVKEDVLKLLQRRPCRAVDIADSLDLSYREAAQAVSELLDKKLLSEKKSDGDKYFSSFR